MRRDVALLPNGAEALREIIEHNGGVCVAALTDDNEVLMVKQFRYPYGEVIMEIPAGKRDSKDENPLECGMRELEEETGAKAQNFTFLGELYPTPGYCGEVIWMYAATGLTFGEQNTDEDEFLNVISPYQRETVKNAAIQFVSYGYVDSFEVDENVDVNDDKAFAPYVKAYLSYFASSGYSVKIDSFESSDVIYYNNTSSTYDLYAKQYLSKSSDNKNVQLYADINCSLDLTIKSDQTSQSESSTEEYKIVCAKIDGKWQVVTVLAAE